MRVLRSDWIDIRLLKLVWMGYGNRMTNLEKQKKGKSWQKVRVSEWEYFL